MWQIYWLYFDFKGRMCTRPVINREDLIFNIYDDPYGYR